MATPSSSSGAAALSISLPPRAPTAVPSVWKTVAPPADAPCSPSGSGSKECNVPAGTCCRDTDKGGRTLLDPDVVRDIVIGLSDGLTVPFALTAGLSSLGSSKIVVLGGVAELIAGAISMGIGGFLASAAERDHFHYLRRQTHERVLRLCESEMSRKVHDILGPVGMDEEASRMVASQLRKVETDTVERALANNRAGSARWWGLRRHLPQPQAEAAQQEKDNASVHTEEDMGLTAFLLKFGEGMEEVPIRRLYLSALTIGSGYFFGGLVPLLPYFFLQSTYMALYYSILLTGVILLIFGVVKTHFTGGTGGWGGYAWGAISTLIVGTCAAGSSFGIVRAIESKYGADSC